MFLELENRRWFMLILPDRMLAAKDPAYRISPDEQDLASILLNGTPKVKKYGRS
jgi:hypothetical protein